MGEVCCTQKYTIQYIQTFQSSEILTQQFTVQKELPYPQFGKIFLVTKNNQPKLYTMKILPKQAFIKLQNKFSNRSNRNLLTKLNSDFIVKLHYSFQTFQNHFMVFENLQSGDLQSFIKTHTALQFQKVIFYAIEVLLALQDLQRGHIIYRNLKPQNILIDIQGHIKLADFDLLNQEQLNKKILQAPEYSAPEVLKGRKQGHQADFWSFGVLLYQLLTGRSPFVSRNPRMLLKKIFAGKYKLDQKVPQDVRNLIEILLRVNPRKRPRTVKDIMDHKVFSQVD